MRPASEIYSALALVTAELDRAMNHDAIRNLGLVMEVLMWVTGEGVCVDPDAPNSWLAAYLLDDPPQLDSTPPEVN